MKIRHRLEEWAVELYLIRSRNRIPKSKKAENRRMMQHRVTKLSVETLADMIGKLIRDMEIM